MRITLPPWIQSVYLNSRKKLMNEINYLPSILLPLRWNSHVDVTMMVLQIPKSILMSFALQSLMVTLEYLVTLSKENL